MPKHDPQRHDFVVDRIKKILAHREPEFQGAVLGELVAIFVAAHHPALRDMAIDMHVGLVRELVPVIERELFGPGGFPIDKEGNKP